MSNNSPRFPFHYSIVLIILFITVPGVWASQTAPLPDQPAPGYHPGLFSDVSAEHELIPPVVNTYEEKGNVSSNTSPMISYSFIPGNAVTGKNPTVTGFISGAPANISVNITGRDPTSESFRYLTTIQPDEKGIFTWNLPEWASNYTEVMVGIVRT